MTPAEVEASIASFADVPDDVAPAPAAEAKGGTSCACAGHREPGDPEICRGRYREMLEAVYADDYGDTAEVRDALLRHDAALRTRAREAEFRAEHAKGVIKTWGREYLTACDERDEAREREAEERRGRIEVAASYERVRDALGVTREDDRPLEVAEALSLAAIAAANARAEEKEAERVTANEAATDADRVAATKRAARVAAEAEERRVRALIGTRAGRTLADAVHDAMTSLREYHEGLLVEETGKLKAAEAEVKRLRGAATASVSETTAELVATFRKSAAGMGRRGYAGVLVEEACRAVNALEAENARLRERVAEDNAVCLCGCPADQHEDGDQDGESCGRDDHECLRVAPAVATLFAALRERCRRLVAAGDGLRGHGTDPVAHAAWAAAKGEVPNG